MPDPRNHANEHAAMMHRDSYHQRRLKQTRTCLSCGAVLPPERRGYYCAIHGHEERPLPESVLTTPCRGCGRLLRGGRSLCLSCLGGVGGIAIRCGAADAAAKEH